MVSEKVVLMMQTGGKESRDTRQGALSSAQSRALVFPRWSCSWPSSDYFTKWTKIPSDHQRHKRRLLILVLLGRLDYFVLVNSNSLARLKIGCVSNML